MPRFFIDNGAEEGGRIELTGENARHLLYSLRARVGDTVYICDGEGNEYKCVCETFARDSADCRVLEKRAAANEPPYRAVLCQAIPKQDKMDYIVQKAVELGVYRIVPFESANCIAKIKPEAAEKKTERWQRIAESAAKQCGRGIIPEVCRPISFAEVLRMQGNKFFCYEAGGGELGECLRATRKDEILFMIGPEGGFSPAEAQAAADAGWQPVTLGKRILRTETASLYFLSVLSYEKEKK